MAERKCDIYGAELRVDLMEGLCPKWVLKEVMAEEDDSDSGAPDHVGKAPDTPDAPLPRGATSGAAESRPVPEAPDDAVSEKPRDRIGRYKLLQRLAATRDLPMGPFQPATAGPPRSKRRFRPGQSPRYSPPTFVTDSYQRMRNPNRLSFLAFRRWL